MATKKKTRTKRPNVPVDINTLLANETILEGDVTETLKSAALDYAVMTILDRALPDARDGLKPVQRRILFCALKSGFTSDKRFMKSARIVGDVLGVYHPHGDQSVYEAMVKLSQAWYERYQLIDFQGNQGSLDGDPAASYRYTESRLERLTEEAMLEDVADGRCVPMKPNYSDDTVEPEVLPAMLPNLLVNGSYGIAVGYTTNGPSHNLRDVCRTIKLYLTSPDVTDDQLVETIVGPDEPMGGLLLRDAELRQLYTTGKGSLTFRAEHHVETDDQGHQLVVFTSIPPSVKRVAIEETIYEMIRAKTLPRVIGVRDESQGMDTRIVVVCQATARVNEVINDLLRHTDLQQRTSFIIQAVVGNMPRLLTLRQCVEIYVAHRREVIRRQREHGVEVHERKLSNVNALLAVSADGPRAARIISDAEDDADAKAKLIKAFKLTDEQAEYVLELKLRRLTRMNRAKLIADRDGEEQTLAELRADLADVDAVIVRQLDWMAERYGDDRRTKVVDSLPTFSDAVNDETTDGPAKDDVIAVMANGRVRAYDSTEVAKIVARGRLVDRNLSFAKVIVCPPGEEVLAFMNDGTCTRTLARRFATTYETLPNLVALVNLKANATRTALLVLSNGRVKKINLGKVRISDRHPVNLIRDEDLVDARLTKVVVADDTVDDVVTIATVMGYVGRFSLNSFTDAGPTARCLPSSALAEGDQVIDAMVTKRMADDDTKLVLVGVDADGGPIVKTVPMAEVTVKGRTARSLPYTKAKSFGRLLFARAGAGALTVINSTGAIVKVDVDALPVLGREARFANWDVDAGEQQVIGVDELLNVAAVG